MPLHETGAHWQSAKISRFPSIQTLLSAQESHLISSGRARSG